MDGDRTSPPWHCYDALIRWLFNNNFSFLVAIKSAHSNAIESTCFKASQNNARFCCRSFSVPNFSRWMDKYKLCSPIMWRKFSNLFRPVVA